MDAKDFSSSRKLTLTFTAVTGGLPFFCLYFLFPPFVDTFASFGRGLPLLTQLVFLLAPAYILFGLVSFLPLVALTPLVANDQHKLIFSKLSVAYLVVSSFYFVVALVSLYLPLYSLGAVAYAY